MLNITEKAGICLDMCEYALIMLNMIEYARIWQKNRVLNYSVPDALHTIQSLYNILSSY